MSENLTLLVELARAYAADPEGVGADLEQLADAAHGALSAQTAWFRQAETAAERDELARDLLERLLPDAVEAVAA